MFFICHFSVSPVILSIGITHLWYQNTTIMSAAQTLNRRHLVAELLLNKAPLIYLCNLCEWSSNLFLIYIIKWIQTKLGYLYKRNFLLSWQIFVYQSSVWEKIIAYCLISRQMRKDWFACYQKIRQAVCFVRKVDFSVDLVSHIFTDWYLT